MTSPEARQSPFDRRAAASPASEPPGLDGNPVERNIKTEAGRRTPVPRDGADTPPLGDATNVAMPSRPELAVGPKAFAAAPDPHRPPPLPPLVRGPADAAKPTADPTHEATRQFLFAAGLTLRLAPAPFLRVGVPDPFEHARTARLANEPPEPLHVESKPSRPERPVLPVK